MRKQKFTALVVILAFLINTLPGAMLNPMPSQAYHRDDDQQGHTGTIGGASDCSKPNGKPCPPKRSPVDIKTGEFSDSYQDLFFPGRGLPLQVTRSYNSRDLYEGPFGHGWKFNMEIKLTVAASGSQEVVTIRTADGVRLDFSRNQDGSYSAPTGWSDHLIKNSDGSFTWTQGPCTGSCGSPRYLFDSSGYLVSITDPNNNQMTFSYDSKGKLTQVTDAPGRKLTISYGSNSKITGITDPAGRIFTYGYDANDNLITYADPAGNTVNYGYDGAHNLISITDARGNLVTGVKYDDQERVTEYTENGAKWTYSYYPASNTTYKYLPNSWDSWTFNYDANGLVVSERDPLWNTTGYAYNDKLYMVSTTDPLWATVSFEYDDRGNRTGITDPFGNKTVFAYHSTLNKVTTITDALGRTTAFSYDDRGNLILQTDPAGNKTSWSYNQYGQMIEKADALGNTTKYGYDSYGNVNSVTDALGKTVAAVYDILGNRTTLTDGRGNTASYSYDVLGNLVSVTDALGNATTYEYDQNSNMTKIIDAGGNAVGYEYDGYNRLTKATFPLGNVVTRSYDVLGRTSSETDGNGNTVTYSYDLGDRLTKKTLADGTEVSQTYDSNGNILTVVDGKGNTTSYGYNAMDRLTQISYPNGTKELFTYDKVGRTSTRIDQQGRTTSYAYDDLNRLTTRTYADNSQATFGYDALGRLVSAGNANSQVSYTYDELSRVTKSVQDGLNVEYGYDEVGNRTKLFYPYGTYYSYAYDALNRLTQIADSKGYVFAGFSYDSLSRRSKLTYGNGTETTYEHYVDGRLKGMTTKKVSSGQVIASFAYTYDNAFNRTSMSDLSGTETYSFDKKYQTTKVTYGNGKSESFSYDKAYNRTIRNDGKDINYFVNNMNQYSNIGTTTYSYDQNENLSSDGINIYSYDYDNRLIQVVGNGNTIAYSYDALGRLVAKSVNNTATKYLLDGDRIIAEIGPANQVTHYVFGRSLDEILGIVKTDTGKHYYCYPDGLGSIRTLSDSGGAVVESYAYDVYGKTTITDGSGNVIPKSAIGNPNLFAGRLYDPETGLYYYRARHYHPDSGRFLQMDPAGQFVGDLNLYSYVRNNPVNFVDPSGLVPFKLVVAALILIGVPVALVINSYLHPEQQENRRLSDWAAGQNMADAYAYGRYPPEAVEELQEVHRIISENYNELRDFQCNAAATAGYNLLTKHKWKVLKFELVDYRKAGMIDMNMIEIRLQNQTIKDYVNIYLGPWGRDPQGHGIYGTKKPLYDSRSTYIDVKGYTPDWVRKIEKYDPNAKKGK